jgi:hypothetical protein
LDDRVKAYPEISFLIEKDGKPQDVQQASVDTRVEPLGKLVIWMMAPNEQLFQRLNSYGLHALRVHYANGWFGKFGNNSKGQHDDYLGKIRLEAATGEDFSEEVAIAKPDGMKERAIRMVQWLVKENPQGKWGYFLTPDRKDLRWDRVIMCGASHGSTTSARFAKHQKVDRVVMLCGPRDQFENWQGLPSETTANRFFGFSHVLDSGWTGDHYCRSWELLGLHEFGEIVNVDESKPPYNNTRRLITAVDVKGDANKAHGCVQPGGSAIKDSKGNFVHDAVWKYMFTHPVDEVGSPDEKDSECVVTK